MSMAPINPTRQRLKTVSVFIMIYGVISLIYGMLQAAGFVLTFAVLAAENGMPSENEAPAVFGVFGGGALLGILTLAIGVFYILGARSIARASGYGMAMFASIMLIIPCGNPLCFIGLPLGIWSFITLGNQDVKNEFLLPK